MIWAAFAIGIVSVLIALSKYSWIKKQNPGGERLQEIGQFIADGAMAFMKREYKIMFFVILAVVVLLAVFKPGQEKVIAISFVTGAFLSGLAGLIGMKAATKANMRTAHSAKDGIIKALHVAFTGGSVMGLTVVGLALAGLALLTIIYTSIYGTEGENLNFVVQIISGYSLGASSVALFARVGGGIFTKAADVGADLVGKVEAGIPEDDPRNPATIADNVGDNVGDVAGLGSDLCESYIASIIGSMVLGAELIHDYRFVVLPIAIAAIGILASIVGTLFVKTKEDGNPQFALNLGTMGASALMLVLIYPFLRMYVPAGLALPDSEIVYSVNGIFFAIISGLIGGVLIGVVTEYYTADNRKPVQMIAQQSMTGPATNIIAGLQVGMMATGLPVIILIIAIMSAYRFAGLYGIAIAALGMLGTTGIQLAVDAYGPIADNAGGLAEMAKLDAIVRERTDKLDSVGNTTAAIGKGFAIGSAALTALALFVAYKETAGIDVIDVTKAEVVCGLLFGAMLPFVFSAMLMGAVGRAAFKMIEEVRRQFRDIKGVLEGDTKPDYIACVDIATQAAISEMIIPSVAAVVIPVLVGFIGGKEMLGGTLVGVTASGVMLALFMANAGGAWDNAKKYIESGHFGGKGSVAHKASIIGDTVGDPFKDTAGPAMDIIIKLMSVVALIIAKMI
jgi:K(+)-stimulated pyrophosphate-energized sodium pump